MDVVCVCWWVAAAVQAAGGRGEGDAGPGQGADGRLLWADGRAGAEREALVALPLHAPRPQGHAEQRVGAAASGGGPADAGGCAEGGGQGEPVHGEEKGAREGQAGQEPGPAREQGR
eukprot:3539471-Rhodomonas_salina.3